MSKIVKKITEKLDGFFRVKPSDGVITYVLKNLFARIDEHDVVQSAAQLAYFSLLSVFPFVIFVNALIGSMNLSKDFVIEILSEIFPLQISQIIGNYVEYVSGLGNGVGIISVGVIVALFSASKSVRAIGNAVNNAYGIHDKRFFLMRLVLSVILTCALGIVIFLCLFAVTVGREWIYRMLLMLDIPTEWLNKISVGKWAIVFAAFLLILVLIYYAVPLKKMKLRQAFPGALFAITSNFVLTFGYSIYMAYFENFSVLYGSLGAVLLLALWLYFVGMFIVLGAEVNSILEERKYYLALNGNKKNFK